MYPITRIFILLTLLLLLGSQAAISETRGGLAQDDLSVELSDFVVSGVPTDLTITVLNDSIREAWTDKRVKAMINGKEHWLVFEEGEVVTRVTFDRKEPFSLKIGPVAFVRDMNPMPLWLSVFPPLIAIVLALVFREVIVSLFIGIFFGASVVGYYTDGLSGFLSGFFKVIDTYMINALNDWGHLAVVLFSLFIGAIVAVVSRNGGMMGVVNHLARFATNARSGQLTTWAMGIAIFFDDYANTLVVGNTLRPITDRLRISREKLAYIVDSTAAPIAAIAFITTWIGAQLGYIDSGLDIINAQETQIAMGSYGVLVNSLAYSFYPVLTLVFIFMLVWMRRDYGPMHAAEVLARKHGPIETIERTSAGDEIAALQPDEDTPQRPLNAIIPIAVVIFGTVTGLLVTGWSAEIWADPGLGVFRKLAATIGASDSYTALLWSSLSGLTVAVVLTVGQGLMSLSNTLETVFAGFKTMLSAIVILVLAWSLAAVTEQMHSADFLTGLITGNVPYWVVPAMTFILAALVAFSTGSSWGTMAILYPLMLPLSWTVCQAAGCDLAVSQATFFHVVSAVLAGSVLGDHCSPISDTTILSSLATSVNHMAHVNTQLPYALTVGGVAVALSLLAAALDLNGLLLMPVGAVLLFGIIRWVGKVVGD